MYKSIRVFLEKLYENKTINFCNINFNLELSDRVIVYDNKSENKKKELECFIGSIPKLLEETDIAVIDEGFKEYQVWKLNPSENSYTVEIYIDAPDHIEKPASMKIIAN